MRDAEVPHISGGIAASREGSCKANGWASRPRWGASSTSSPTRSTATIGVSARARLERIGRLRQAALSRARPSPASSPAMPSSGSGSFPTAAARTLTVSDNGIGMTRQELIDNLGTIARSGTAAFLEAASGDQAKDVSLIGQFGVGFYAAFMVADEVRVVSRRAGETEAHEWRSDGQGRVHAGAGGARGPRHRRDPASEEGGGRIPRAGSPQAHRRQIFRSHRAADPDRRGPQGRTRERRLGALDAPEIRDHRAAIRRVLSPCRACLRPAVADAAFPRRRQDRVQRPAFRADIEADRPLRSDAQQPPQALCPARLHHRPMRRAAAALAPVPARHRRFRGSAAQHQPRDAAAQSAHREDPPGHREARPGRAAEEGRGRAGGLRRFLEAVRRGAEGRALRAERSRRAAAWPSRASARPAPTSSSRSPITSAA